MKYDIPEAPDSADLETALYELVRMSRLLDMQTSDLHATRSSDCCAIETTWEDWKDLTFTMNDIADRIVHADRLYQRIFETHTMMPKAAPEAA